MRLSEAIKLGAMLHPQGFNEFRNHLGGTCALGAAGDAVGKEFIDIDQCARLWPEVAHENKFACPVCGTLAYPAPLYCIPHLNDSHHWTRERIADWIATHELRDATADPVQEIVTA